MFNTASITRPRLGKSIIAAGAVSLVAAIGTLGAGAGSANAAGFTTAECSGTAIIGGGASFPKIAHESAYIALGWDEKCGASKPSVTYRSSGSGCGMQLMGRKNSSCSTFSPYSSDGTGSNTDGSKSRSYTERFGQSDDPLSTSNISEINAGTSNAGDEGEIIQIPNALGALAVVVNTPNGCTIFQKPGTTDIMSVGSGDTGFTAAQQAQISDFGSANAGIARLQLTRSQLEGIFRRSTGYQKWGDIVPWINDGNGTASEANDTRCVNFPIIRVKRADDSGSTYALKDFLNAINSSGSWKSTYGSGNQKWPNATDLVAFDYNNDGDTADSVTNCAMKGASGTGGDYGPAYASWNTTDGSTYLSTGVGCVEANVPTLQTSNAASAGGGGALIDKVNDYDGSIGYGVVADARARKTQAFERQSTGQTATTVASNDDKYWVKLQTRKSGGTSPDGTGGDTFADATIGNGYQSGTATNAKGSNCSAAVVKKGNADLTLADLRADTTSVTAVDSSDTGYPACTLSYALVWKDYLSPYALNIAANADPAAAKIAEEKKARTVVDYLRSSLNEGQAYVSRFDYAPLPTSIKALANNALDMVTFDGYSDATAPSAPGLAGAPTGSVTTKSATITVTPAESGGTVEYKVDSGDYQPLTITSGTGTISLSNLALGSHTVSVRQTDAAGNVGAVATATWTVVVSQPQLSGAPSGSTLDRTASITITGDAGQTFKCSLDGAEYTVCTSPKSLTGLAFGEHTFRAKAVDGEGNESAATSATWTVSKPAAPLAPTVTGAPTGSTTLKTATLEVTPAQAGGTVEYKVNGGSYQPLTISGGKGTIALSGLAVGSVSVSVRQTDEFDSAGADRTVDWTVAAVSPPQLSGAPSGTTRSSTATITITGGAGLTFKCSLDGASYTVCTSPRSLTGLALGVHTFSAKAVDSEGNESAPATASWTITKPAAPTVTVNPTGNVAKGQASIITFSGEAGSTYTCSIDGGTYGSCTSGLSVANTVLGNHSVAVKQTNGGQISDAATRNWVVVPDNRITVTSIAWSKTSKSVTVKVNVPSGGGTIVANARWTKNGVSTLFASPKNVNVAKTATTATITFPASAAMKTAVNGAGTTGIPVSVQLSFTPPSAGGVTAVAGTATTAVTAKK